jgi:hypothetical protein
MFADHKPLVLLPEAVLLPTSEFAGILARSGLIPRTIFTSFPQPRLASFPN